MNTLLLSIILSFSVDFNVSVEAVKFKFIEQEQIPDLGLDPDKKGNVKFHAFCRHKDKTIFISKEHWDSLPFVHKRELIYHELGHCHFYLRHTTEVAIMRPRVYSTELDGSNWRKLVNDMNKTVRSVKK